MPDLAELDDLLPCTDAAAGWSDHHGVIALSWPRPEQVGLQRVQAMVGFGATTICHDLLAWRLAEAGREVPLRVVRRSLRPDRVLEIDAGDEVEIAATAAWPARHALAIDLRVENRSPRLRTLALSFTWPGRGVAPRWAGPFPVAAHPPGWPNSVVGHHVEVADEPVGSWSTVFRHLIHGLNIDWCRSFCTGMGEADLELVCLADLAPRVLALPPGAGADHRVLLAFGTARFRAAAARTAAQARIRRGWSPADEERRWQAHLLQAPPLPPERQEPRWRRMQAHAVAALRQLHVRGDGGYTGGLRVPWTVKHNLAIPFFHDTAYTAMAMARVDPALAMEGILAFCRNPSPRGGLPGTLCDTHRSGEGQSPVMAWAAWQCVRARPDRAWLAEAYPALAGHVRHWRLRSGTPDGLHVWRNAGQVADNDPRFDRVQGADGMNRDLAGFCPPDLQGFLINEMRALAGLAEHLGRPAEAAAWRAEATALGARLVAAMWFPDELLFRDVELDAAGRATRTPFSRALSPFYFIPFLTALPLAPAEIQAGLRRHLLDPATFFGERPFPSCARNHPAYDPGGYWRGRIWPITIYAMCCVLHRNGFAAEAAEGAERALRMFAESPFLHENYHGESGGPLGQRNGFPDYNWGLGVAIQLLDGAWRDPLPA